MQVRGLHQTTVKEEATGVVSEVREVREVREGGVLLSRLWHGKSAECARSKVNHKVSLGVFI